MTLTLPRPAQRYDERDQGEVRAALERHLRAMPVPESGFYVPTVTSSGGGETITYSTAQGHYTRVGSLVWFAADLTLATKSGGSGNIQVSLPVAACDNLTQAVPVVIDAMGATWTGAPQARIFNLGTIVRIRELVSGAQTAAWGKLGATCIIRVTGTYRV